MGVRLRNGDKRLRRLVDRLIQGTGTETIPLLSGVTPLHPFFLFLARWKKPEFMSLMVFLC